MRSVPLPDLLIAAVAERHHVTILHHDPLCHRPKRACQELGGGLSLCRQVRRPGWLAPTGSGFSTRPSGQSPASVRPAAWSGRGAPVRPRPCARSASLVTELATHPERTVRNLSSDPKVWELEKCLCPLLVSRTAELLCASPEPSLTKSSSLDSGPRFAMRSVQPTSRPRVTVVVVGHESVGGRRPAS